GQLLRVDVDQCVEVDLAPVGRLVLEFEVHVVVGDGAVFDDDLVDDAMHQVAGVLVAQPGHEPVRVVANLVQPVVGGELHAEAVEGGEVGGVEGADDVVSHESVGGDDLDLRAVRGEAFCGGQCLVAAVIVENEYARPWGHIARKDVPGRHGQVGPGHQSRSGRQASGGDDHGVGFECLHGSGVGE